MNRVLYAFIDMALTAASYDFVTALVRAMKVRDERGCTDLHVVFVPNEKDPAAGFLRRWGKHDDAAAYWRFWHICVASLPLARATMTLAPSRALAKEMTPAKEQIWWPEGKGHFMGPLVEAARRGETIPRLRATTQANNHVFTHLAGMDDPSKLVTLTLREQDTDHDRNTNAAVWGGFSKWLESQGFSPLFIHDTPQALDQGRGYAELDPDLRLAVYEQARMNIIGNNGPQELLKFSDAPYLAFGQCPTVAWADHWRKYFGMEPGEQLPWASKNQRLVYASDTLENLKAEFLRWAFEPQG